MSHEIPCWTRSQNVVQKSAKKKQKMSKTMYIVKLKFFDVLKILDQKYKTKRGRGCLGGFLGLKIEENLYFEFER